MNLGIVTPQLSHYGGSEVYLLECLRRWQDVIDVTLYTPLFRRDLMAEFDVGSRVKVVRLPGGRIGPDAFFYNTVVLPRVWEQMIGPHAGELGRLLWSAYARQADRRDRDRARQRRQAAARAAAALAPRASWVDWLRQKAAVGDAEALTALRRRKEATRSAAGLIWIEGSPNTTDPTFVLAHQGRRHAQHA